MQQSDDLSGIFAIVPTFEIQILINNNTNIAIKAIIVRAIIFKNIFDQYKSASKLFAYRLLSIITRSICKMIAVNILNNCELKL